MNIPAPHFLLFSEAKGKKRQGQWRFVLQAADGSATLEAEDQEPEVGGERLELLAVIRGLEALDQPSRVTLFTPSKYVSRGIAYGLEEWRRNDWTWECFGEMVPVKNRDLWQRLDRALSYHTIEFRIQRTDEAHTGLNPAVATVGSAPRGVPENAGGSANADGRNATEDVPYGVRNATEGVPYGDGAADPSAVTVRSGSRHAGKRLSARLSRSLRERAESWRIRCGQLGTALLPKPWLE
ncbi:MAG TPA: RNase H family protein [Pirellulales bacterium]|nr:RNase H family protein [Pirellulales bacterium]